MKAFLLEFIKITSMLLWKLPWWLCNEECMPEGETEDLMWKVIIFNCFSSSVCPYIHPSLHFVLKFQAPLHETVNFKVITKWYTIWRPFFRALLVSWGFSTTAPEYSSLGLLSSVNVSCASKFTQQQKKSRNFWMSTSSKSGNWSGTWQANTMMFLLSLCWLVNFWKSLTNFSQSFFQHPFRTVYFRLSPDSFISTIQLAVLYNFQHSLTLRKAFFSLVLFQRY